MSYATLSHVHSRDQGRAPFTANTKPAAADVVRYLAQTAAEIDGIIASRNYTLPIPTSATAALDLLEGYNADGADCLVQRGAQNSGRRKDACDAWAAAKKALETVDLAPLGVPIGDSGLIALEPVRDPMFSFPVELSPYATAPNF